MQARFTAARWLFLRLLGLVYLCAFLSYWVQFEGLIGPDGILPAQDYFNAAAKRLGWYERIWLLPSLCWLGAGKFSLHLQFASGTLLSVLLLAGILERWALPLLWVLYLSLTIAGQVFFGYQWDALLLEAGLIAVLLAPSAPGAPQSPAFHCGLFLERWLLFRLMFFSGVVKLASGDQAWQNLTALQYHYYTQPLPNLPAYYLHRAPAWFHTSSTVIMFGIELIAPFFIFGPRWMRLACAGILLFLQAAIACTGNYAFFNLLTAALCLLLLDDAAISRLLPKRIMRRFTDEPSGAPQFRFVYLLWNPFALGLLLLSSFQVWTQVFGPYSLPPAIDSLAGWSAPFRSVNRYGLFAVMTTERPEIIVEGTNDFREWRPYRFKWKPQALDDPPRQAAPHQPRLDWQMWFAALGSYDYNPWFLRFVERLLQGSPAVDNLIEENPFPDSPPKYIRALVYKYRFTSLHEKATESRWWSREIAGTYLPAVSLEQFKPPALGKSPKPG